jgi:hypothetical protein
VALLSRTASGTVDHVVPLYSTASALSSPEIMTKPTATHHAADEQDVPFNSMRLAPAAGLGMKLVTDQSALF